MKIRLTGLLVELSEETVTLEQDGVAWEIMVPRGSLPELAAARGRSVTLHTLEFLEGNQFGGNIIPRLVGFTQAADKEFFLKFIEVKGIGLRKALRALEHPAGAIARWIEDGDVKSLSTLPGIGKRGAELIVAQLRGKLGDLAMTRGAGVETPRSTLSREQRDALEILVAWGDPRMEVERWIRQAGESNGQLRTADEWVRAAYRMKAGAT